MENLYKHIFVLALIVIVTPACGDQLTKAPLDSPSDAMFFSNQGELEMALNGIYNRLWWHINSHQAVQNLDNTTDIGFLRDGSIRDLADGSSSSESQGFEMMWEDLYQGIARANNLLQNKDKAQDVVTEEFLVRVEAEARFLRAFYYHYLTGLYGDVPLLTEVPTIEEAEIGRTSKSEVVNQIISDLEFASENLPVNWSGDDEGRSTKGAALTLMARVALYNEDYDLAIQAAQDVIDLDEYSLYPDYENLFQYEGIRNSEVIFDVPYQQGVNTHSYPQRAGSRMVGSFSTVVPSQFMVDSYQASDGLPIDQSGVYDPSQPFENRDPRLDASIVRSQSTFGGYVFETHPDSTETTRTEDGARVSNQDVTNPFATFTGYLWRKYNDIEDYPENRRSSELNFIFMRYAEVFLTYAEAKIESNDIDQSVLNALNRIRARGYGVDFSQTGQYPEITSTDQTVLRREVRNERKVELANEGFRLFDIRRWGIADIVMDGPLIGRPIGAYSEISSAPAINENGHPDYGALQDFYRHVIERTFRSRDWLYAIPQSEINVNENVTQNPGY